MNSIKNDISILRNQCYPIMLKHFNKQVGGMVLSVTRNRRDPLGRRRTIMGPAGCRWPVWLCSRGNNDMGKGVNQADHTDAHPRLPGADGKGRAHRQGLAAVRRAGGSTSMSATALLGRWWGRCSAHGLPDVPRLRQPTYRTRHALSLPSCKAPKGSNTMGTGGRRH